MLFSDSPISPVLIEHYREQAAQKRQLGSGVGVDRLVLGRGELVRREVTKVGGLPYRPAGTPWPKDNKGQPLEFMVQFSFAESLDIVGDLPGDVLLVFAEVGEALIPVNKRSFIVDPRYHGDVLQFEWQPRGMTALCSVGDCPSPRVEFPVCQVMRWRSTDSQYMPEAEREIGHVVPDDLLSQNQFWKNTTLKALQIHPRMKIGGLPFCPPGGCSELPSGKFLCSFWGVNPAFDVPYPWFNEPRPLSLDECGLRSNMLLFRDGCCLNFFLEADGRINWSADFF